MDDQIGSYCQWWKKLKKWLYIKYQEIDISSKDGLMDEMIKKSNGKRTIPQIFSDDLHIGGYEELRALEKEKKLENLLK